MRVGTLTTFRRLLRPAKRGARATAEALWTMGFSLGRLGTQTARWSSPGSQRVVVVAPHPDDETIGCGGTLALHAAAGDEVTALIATDGRRSRAMGLPPEEMARRRRGEAEEATRALGLARLVWLGLPEGEWTKGDLAPRLRDALTSLAPDVLYAPSRVDFHPEHVRVAHELGAVVDALLGTRVRVYQIQVPLTSVLVNLVNDVSRVEALRHALDAYVTQAANKERALRQRRYAAAFHGPRGLAEEFWELSPAAYAALHRGEAEAEPEPWKTFRGVRHEPWTDPLAYLVGRADRVRLAAQEKRSR